MHKTIAVKTIVRLMEADINLSFTAYFDVRKHRKISPNMLTNPLCAEHDFVCGHRTQFAVANTSTHHFLPLKHPLKTLILFSPIEPECITGLKALCWEKCAVLCGAAVGFT